MEERVKKYIQENKLIHQNSKILIALSGGKDSVFLLHILNKLKNELNIKLYAAHVNHMIRSESDNDENFIVRLCSENNIKSFILKKDVKKYAEDNNLSVEEAGREVRYKFFEKIANENNIDVIATAHNMDDQAETVLYKILRGTGLDGLKGIGTRDNIIRPIISISKEEILNYLKKNNIDYREDKTNEKPIYLRNRIRLELLPYLKENYNENITATLVRLSENIKSDYEIIKKCVDSEFEKIVKTDKQKVTIDIKKFNDLQTGMKNRIIRKAFNSMDELYNLEKKHIDIIVRLAMDGKTGKFINIHNNMTVKVVYNEIIIQEKEIESKEYIYKYNVGEKLYIKEAKQTIYSCFTDSSCYGNNLKNRIFIDADKIGETLIIRNRKKGDKFIPSGMNNHKKLKDFFIDEKVPGYERDLIPIVEFNNEILWIAGYRISEKFKADKNTKKLLKWRLYNSMDLEKITGKILFSQEELALKVKELGQKITKDYADKNLMIVCVLTGAIVFMTDLIREINLPMSIDFMAVSSYGDSTKSSGVVKILKDLDKSVEGKDILIVEDIIESGLTLAYLMENIKSRSPNSVNICTLLDKPQGRKTEVDTKYIGYKIENEFVVGYGLDFAEKYRNIPYIFVPSEEGLK